MVADRKKNWPLRLRSDTKAKVDALMAQAEAAGYPLDYCDVIDQLILFALPRVHIGMVRRPGLVFGDTDAGKKG